MNIFQKISSKFFRPQLSVGFDSGERELPTIVFLHGIGASSTVWDTTIAQLKYSNYRCFSLDLLGFGRSTKLQGSTYDADEHVSYILRSLKKNRINKPFVLVGHSMGALIATHYATLYPSQVSELYLIGMPLLVDRSPNGQDFNAHVKSSKRKRTVYGYFRNNPQFTMKNTQRLKKIMKVEGSMDVNKSNWEAFTKSLLNTVEEQNTYQQLHDLELPIYQIYGNLDTFIVKKNLELLAKEAKITTHRIRVVGHALTPKFSKLIAEIIRDNLRIN